MSGIISRLRASSPGGIQLSGRTKRSRLRVGITELKKRQPQRGGRG